MPAEYKYYYVSADNHAASGPVSPEDLPMVGITYETWIWREGLADWTRAWAVAELAPMFEGVPRRGYYDSPVTLPPKPSHDKGKGATVPLEQGCNTEAETDIGKQSFLDKYFWNSYWPIIIFFLIFGALGALSAHF